MATRGRKTTVIAAACGVAVLVVATVAFWDDAVIEWHVRRLHSEDEATRDEAAKALAGFGARVMPRLLEEVEEFERCRLPASGSEWWIADQASGAVIEYTGPPPLPVEVGFLQVFSVVGATAVPPVIRSLDLGGGRCSRVLLAAVVHHWTHGVFARAIQKTTRQWTADQSMRSPSVKLPGAPVPEHSIGILEGMDRDLLEPVESRLAASEMFAKLKAKHTATKAE